MTTTPQSGADLLNRVKPTKRREKTQLCLRPDLLDQWEEANEALTEERAKEATRLAGGGAAPRGVTAKAKKVQELEAEIESTSIWFEMENTDKIKWQSICDQHPPRRDNQTDVWLGYNNDAVADEAIRVCLVSPVFEDCEKKSCKHEDCGSWQALEHLLNPSEWAELRELCRSVNRSVTAPPKSLAASAILARRRRGSEQPAATE